MTLDKYRQNYDAIKWTQSAPLPRGNSIKSEKAFVVMKDIDPFVSPIDGKMVGSRSSLRDHERRHNVRQIGNDWAGSERPDNWDKIKNGRN